MQAVTSKLEKASLFLKENLRQKLGTDLGIAQPSFGLRTWSLGLTVKGTVMLEANLQVASFGGEVTPKILALPFLAV